MKPTPKTALVLASFLTALVAGCSNSSGGGNSAAAITESEPNDTTAQAKALSLGDFGHGTVADDTDTDFWKINLTANDVVTVEVMGNRLDQTTWTAGGNAARVSLFDTDGTTLLLEQSDESFDWNGDQDTDIFAFRVPATGTYFLQLDVATVGMGGDYLVTTRPMTHSLPMQLELELEGVSGDNDTDATAETIVPGTVVGFHVDDEADFYVFTVAAASLVKFTTYGHRNGVWQNDSYYDPSLTLHDSAMNVLASDDDSYYLDSSIHYLITTPGQYFIEVNECCADGDSGYFLDFAMDEFADLNPVAEVEPNDSIGTAQAVQFGDFLQGDVDPANEDFFALACNAGDRVYVQIFDVNNFQDALNAITVTIEDGLAATVSSDGGNFGLQFQRTILPATDTYFVHVTTVTATDYALRFTQLPATFETEPNDVILDAGTFDVDGLAAGVMDMAADADLFSFQGTANVPVILSILADDVGPNGYFEEDGFGSNMAPILNIMDGAATVLATSDSTVGNAVGINDGVASVSLVFLPPTTGTYYVEVLEQSGSFGVDYTYVLQMR